MKNSQNSDDDLFTKIFVRKMLIKKIRIETVYQLLTKNPITTPGHLNPDEDGKCQKKEGIYLHTDLV